MPLAGCCSTFGWYTRSLSKWQAMARGSITDVLLGGASGTTEVITARSWRVGQKYYTYKVNIGTWLRFRYSVPYCVQLPARHAQWWFKAVTEGEQET